VLLRLLLLALKLVRRYFDIPKNGTQETAPEILAAMHWKNSCASIGMPIVGVASFLTDQRKTQMPKNSGHLGG